MSAPPIGMISRKPIRNASTVSAMIRGMVSAGPLAIANSAVSTMIAASVPRLMTWRAGKRIGEPLMRPESLAKAMTEPEKVIAPMAMPRPISTFDTAPMLPSTSSPKAPGLR